MAQALPFIMAGISVAQGIQGYQQNSAMAKAATAAGNANIANEQNSLAIKQQNLKRQQELQTGKATVSAAGSGATLGSFDSLFEDNANLQQVDKLMLDYDSKLTQENIRYNAAVQKTEYKGAARSSLIGGIVGAGTSLAGANFGGANPGGQTIGKAVSSSPTGPYLNYGSRTLSGY